MQLCLPEHNRPHHYESGPDKFCDLMMVSFNYIAIDLSLKFSNLNEWHQKHIKDYMYWRHNNILPIARHICTKQNKCNKITLINKKKNDFDFLWLSFCFRLLRNLNNIRLRQNGTVFLAKQLPKTKILHTYREEFIKYTYLLSYKKYSSLSKGFEHDVGMSSSGRDDCCALSFPVNVFWYLYFKQQ